MWAGSGDPPTTWRMAPTDQAHDGPLLARVHRQIDTDDLFVVAHVDRAVGECRVGPDDVAAGRAHTARLRLTGLEPGTRARYLVRMVTEVLSSPRVVAEDTRHYLALVSPLGPFFLLLHS